MPAPQVQLMSLRSSSRSVALVLLALTGGCVGEISGTSPYELPPGVDGGPRPDGWVPRPPSADGGIETDAWAPDPLYPHATVGTRCTPEGLREFLILSTEPADCTAHSAALTSDDPSRFVRIALPAGTPSFTATATLCEAGACAPTELALSVSSSASGATGQWSATVRGIARTVPIAATRCDFDAILPPVEQAPIGDVALREVAIYQGVKVTFARDGAAVTPNAPIVAGREGLLRVFVEPRTGFVTRELVARVQLGEGPVLEARGQIGGASRDADLSTTLNVRIPGERISPDVPITIGIYEATSACGAAPPTGGEPARFPASGTATLPARSSGGTLSVVLVPVRYDADGSGRLPDTGQQNLDAFRAHIHSLFPVSDVELQVRSQPMPWSGRVGSDGSGWSALLNECMNLRAGDGAPADTYYYCFFAPAASFREFCGGGCVAGLGPVPSARDTFSRASIGLGFRGSEDTFVHEVGHSMGRPHAPCGGVSGADGSYPYSGGGIGVWGYDIHTGELKNPSQHADLMGYCDPNWISDYNYRLLFDRIRAVRGIAAISGPPVRYATLVVDVDGSVSWGGEVTMPFAPDGEAVDATWTGASTPTEGATGVFVAVDHVDGGIVYVPMPTGDVTRLDVPRFGGVDVP